MPFTDTISLRRSIRANEIRRPLSFKVDVESGWTGVDILGSSPRQTFFETCEIVASIALSLFAR